MFVHVTVPVTSKLTGINGLIKKTKDLVKKLIGRPVFGYHDNIKRGQFNDMLTKQYEGKKPVFDLAKVESTFPDGKRQVHKKTGITFYTFNPMTQATAVAHLPGN